MTCILIPVYEPSEAFPGFIRRLQEKNVRIVVVDDGSTRPVDPIDGTVLLRHDRNRGKGAALKTGFKWILENLPEATVVVTADADGQHSPEDILRVAAATIENPTRATLGVRRFTGRKIPFRSRFGNLWTCGEFRLLTGRWVSDTQSGLRAFPIGFLKDQLAVPGERYEYEIAALVRLARKDLLQELPIATIYLDGNATSHFRPLQDTLRTQSALFKARFA